MTGAMDWQGTVGRNWAAEAARTDRSFSALTPHLLELIDHAAGDSAARIVDIGCGAGQVTAAVAAICPRAKVTGVDISPELVRTAQSRCAAMPNVRVELADAAEWRHTGGPVDLYVSRHGVMFFDDPPAAFRNLAAGAAQGGRIAFSCFRNPAENLWASEIARLLPPSPPSTAPYPPGPFAFADPDHVCHCMAGWKDHAFTPVNFAYIAGAGEDPVADAMDFFARIGPAAAAIRELPATARSAFVKALEALVRDHHVGGLVSFPAAAWLITATVDHSQR
ncbi:class I SAM-dependent methyltransferase [Novosphingobium cyanobacteriorum]|uniref:Class I SAM-dependent methyltransferase n=1 Tax=Novosphingobium cyanobacteriorum TaxID=3024215 RepID=A0ABT6CHQ8_9SPHN|nr:class I SAM-dependent methyltransferase [Novosphingobium cyanobacteriorum]MDF8333464.1 class I SAM-dependent methyltransferase [Novosphingobium cyanobacteriorum]